MVRRRFEDDWPEYVSVGERRRKALREAGRLGQASPVLIDGTRIAKTFWGKSWCNNLERYSDYANRLPRGRTYVRSGCVVDLRISPGKVHAQVSGTRLYRVEVSVGSIPEQRWKAVCGDCAGAIDSIVELLEGRFSRWTMERLCREKTGLFPAPAEMKFTCTCPDSARLCKHVAATLYGVGTRLDEAPELLFLLRNVDQQDLITRGGRHLASSPVARILESEDLSGLFGIEIAEPRRRGRGRKKSS
jgi:uncharacterized Zn finger protein